MPKAHQIVGASCNGVCKKGELKAKDGSLFLKTIAKTVSYPIIFNGNIANIQWEVCKRYQSEFSHPNLKLFF